MKTKGFLLALAGLVVSAGCGGSSKFDLEVVFPDEAAREQTDVVRIMLIRPGQDAGCNALMAGDAAPGDEDFPVEDEVSIRLPAIKSTEPLDADGKGRLLFFAQAEDDAGVAILRGCASLEVSKSGPNRVTINLEWLGTPCEQDADCDDGAWCNGDETCVDGACREGTPPDCTDGDPCTQDVCNEELDACENPPVTDPPAVEGPPDDPSCSDGVDNDCDGQTDDDDTDCKLCTGDADCDDGAWCNGDETCVDGACQEGTPPDCSDGDPCTQDVCNEELDACQNPPVTDPPDEEGPPGDPSCGDGVDNDCDGQTDADDTGCAACTQDAECDDGDTCTEDTCVDGQCQYTAQPDGTACDDGLYCTEPDTCQNGACTGPQRDCSGVAGQCEEGTCDEEQDACVAVPGPAGTACEDGLFCTEGDTCGDDGTCQAGADSPCDNECQTGCDEEQDTCTVSPQGTPCADDGFDCTTDEACDDAGNCIGTPDDQFCEDLQPGSLCLVECASAASGCVLPPETIALSCESPVSLAGSDTSRCTLELTGGNNLGQQACLSCTAAVGITTLAYSDFDDGSGACHDGGWSLVTGNVCRSKIDNCTPGAAPQACCDDFATICETDGFGRPVLRTDYDTNCGGGVKQWQLTREFDATGLSSLRLCFGVADQGATASSGLLIDAEDGTNSAEQVFCLNGGPRDGVDGVFYPRCVDLPAWTAGSPDLRLTFTMHADASGEALYLADISLRGWGAGCAPVTNNALDEDFTLCDVSAWTVVSGTHDCDYAGCIDHMGWIPGIVGDGGPVEIETVVDASALDAEVTACLRIGSDQPAAGDGIALSIDTGTGYQEVWRHQAPLGPDMRCTEVCVNLSDIDPLVENHPALGLRVGIESDGAVGLYGIRLEGAVHCPADASVIDLGPVEETGGGAYELTATDVTGQPLDTRIRCEWVPEPSVAVSSDVSFQP